MQRESVTANGQRKDRKRYWIRAIDFSGKENEKKLRYLCKCPINILRIECCVWHNGSIYYKYSALENGGRIMRIDAYMQVNQLYKTNKTKSDKRSGKADSRDSLEISDFGNAYQVAKQAASEAEPVRTERVREIQAQMAAGTYNVSLEDVADKMADQLLA